MFGRRRTKKQDMQGLLAQHIFNIIITNVTFGLGETKMLVPCGSGKI